MSSKNSIIRNIMTLFFLSALIPTIILSVISLIAVQDNYFNKLYGNYEIILNQYVEQLNYQLERYKFSVEHLRGNEKTLETVRNPDLKNMFDVTSHDLTTISQNTGELLRCTLYTSHAGSEFQYSVDNVENSTWYCDMTERKRYREWFSSVSESRDKILISLAYPIIEDMEWGVYAEQEGVIKLDLFADAVFKNHYPAERLQYFDFMVFLPDKNILFRRGNTSDLEQIISKFSEEDYVTKRFGEDAPLLVKNISLKKIKDQNLYLICRFNDGGRLNKNIYIYIGIELLMVVLLNLLVILYMRRFSKRISILNSKMNYLQKLDFSKLDSVGGNDELAYIDKNFNSMAVKMQELISQNYEQEILIKDAQLNALHFQIKPHFLYNALESISAVAAIEGSSKASRMSQKLGRMFRYNTYMKSDRMTTLWEEIEYIQAYIDIQNVRFDDKFDLQYDIPEEFRYIEFPKFCIQPFIENAVLHAFNDLEKNCIIKIRLSAKDDDILLTICDNGAGIDDEKLTSIRQSLNFYTQSRQQLEHIGILNVHARLLLTYGAGYGVSIDSVCGEGTTIDIKIRINKI